MRLENVVPWGRSKAEYVGMFDLTPQDLFGRILDCAGGPASFNAEMSCEGHEVVSCDPIYRFSAEDIARRVEETYRGIMSGVRANLKGFVWTKIERDAHLSPANQLGTSRREHRRAVPISRTGYKRVGEAGIRGTGKAGTLRVPEGWK